MSNFYHGNDSIGEYWLNLDHVSFVKTEKDKLILKMLNDINVLIDGDDVVCLTQALWNKTVNFYEQKTDDKLYNNEDDLTKKEIETSKKEFFPEDLQAEKFADNDDFYSPFST